ncbi:LysM peptidoglycan-binding domain-containing protein [Fructobacillus evanidus]|uniref:LysM repeat (LysM) n=1 Tax=Fructobacillus evanidus TaxID=3064281 RepID=A0ABM9N1P0_9LACO|nr:LysM repeat (LysM) [Fructobacillus sp. LMG 32999]CAK1249446.1 LysM repeat (LysM) [Fructobacillus sp. LMG 32999]CAK1252818.1 LysM repeat (LysM) [Fructobacillus sp. LMG 32999]CAK1252934.1 LysM repeat (LysM) [Fructobacillus sp. LMG 32999]CAK1253138.1 LysM repeat (LysM) [Fructobacillus sp. LMG 32999]
MNVKKQLLIAAGLAGSVAAGHQAVSADQVQKHTVASGETLSALASRFNTTVAQLASDNQIQNVDQIYQGQELIIGVANSKTVTPSTTTSSTTTTAEGNIYRVQAGDNLWTLAQKFGLSVDQLAQENGIKDTNQIFVGQTLSIKNASQTSSQTAVSQAPASQSTSSQTAVSQDPVSQAVASQAPASQSASSQVAVSQAPVSQAVASQAPASQSASSQVAVSQAPASQAATPVAASQPSQAVQSNSLDSDQAEAQALQTIIMKESGGNVNAANGIYFGIGQLSPTLRARYGGNSTDYQDQLQAMKAYIAARYGTAQAALAHHLQYGWY